MAVRSTRPSTPAENWAAFAGVTFVVLGLFNLVDGLTALRNAKYFSADDLLFGSVRLWGAIYIAVAAAQLLTAALVLLGKKLGTALGIALAAVNAAVALLSVGAYPIWSLTILALDGAVIYALTVHGDALRTTG